MASRYQPTLSPISSNESLDNIPDSLLNHPIPEDFDISEFLILPTTNQTHNPTLDVPPAAALDPNNGDVHLPNHHQEAQQNENFDIIVNPNEVLPLAPAEQQNAELPNQVPANAVQDILPYLPLDLENLNIEDELFDPNIVLPLDVHLQHEDELYMSDDEEEHRPPVPPQQGVGAHLPPPQQGVGAQPRALNLQIPNNLRHLIPTLTQALIKERALPLEDHQELVRFPDQHIPQDYNICDHCMMPPPRNVSLAQHQMCGGFARGHVLYLGPKNDRLIAAIMSSTTLTESVLHCRFCEQFFTDLSVTSQIHFVDHLYEHGSNFGPNSNLEEFLHQTRPPAVYFCFSCSEAFLTLESFTAHAYLKIHLDFYSVYCASCNEIHHHTTTRNHAIRYHQNDLQTMMAVPGTLTDEVIFQNLFGPHLNQEQIQQRHQNLDLFNTQLTLQEVAQQFDFQDGAHNFQNWMQPRRQELIRARARASQHHFPQDLADHIARMVPREVSQNLQQILANIQQTLQLDQYRPFILERKYEVLAFLTSGLIISDLAHARYTPQRINHSNLFNNALNINHRFGPTLLASSTLPITIQDVQGVDLIVFGNWLLSICGTLPTDQYSYLNLSPPTNPNLRFPNEIFRNQPGIMSVQGSINLDGQPTENLPDEDNFFSYLLLTLRRIRTPSTVVVELNLYPFLQKFPCRQWPTIISRSLNTYLSAYFALLIKVKNLAFQETNTPLTICVMGQAPFPSSEELSTIELLTLWDSITEAAVDISRVARILFLPTTGIVAPGSVFSISVTEKPFNQDGSLSCAARTQALSLLNHLSQTLRLLRQLGGLE